MQILHNPPTVGEIINELYLNPANVSQQEAALLCQIEDTLFAKIVNGEVKVGYELAYKLSKGFNTTHTFWLNIQQDFEKSQNK